MKNKTKSIKAELWELNICDSVLDLIHGHTRKIKELYIPSISTAINYADNTLHCFKTQNVRYGVNGGKIKNVKLPDYIENLIQEYFNTKNNITDIVLEILLNEK